MSGGITSILFFGINMPEKKVLFQGDFIASSEEFLPGSGTFTEQGEVKAATIGVLEKDLETREARVRTPIETPRMQRVGQEVIGVINDSRENVAFVDLKSIEQKNVRFVPHEVPTRLAVRNLKRGFVKSLKEQVRTGDIIRAKIIEISPYDVNLSTEAPNLGVILAFCSKCRHMLELKERQLVCPSCEAKETRKIANDYRKVLECK